MTFSSAQQLWEAALGELQLKVSRPNFETWLKDTTGLYYESHILAIGVNNDFVREWLEARLRPVIVETVNKLAGDNVEISFQLVAGETDAEEFERSDRPASKVEVTSAAVSPSMLRPRLNAAYTFEQFVVGPGNRLAHAAAMAVAESPGTTYNPLFIYGGAGLGKTHLLHAIGHRSLQHDRSILYVTAEHFTNEFVAAIAQRKIDDFRRKYRQIQVLLVDDVQFLLGKERTQEEFFYTFNELYANSCQIVITSDRPPKALESLEERLRSRYEGGLIADVKLPDLETRLAILRHKASDRQLELPEDVSQLIARRARHSVRELEGLLNRVAAYTNLVKAEVIDKKVAEEALDAFKTEEQTTVSAPDTILRVVAGHFGVSLDDLRSKRRQKALVEARQVAMYLLHQNSHENLSSIGRLLGKRDHSTVIHGIRSVEAALTSDEELQLRIARIKGDLKSTA